VETAARAVDPCSLVGPLFVLKTSGRIPIRPLPFSRNAAPMRCWRPHPIQIPLSPPTMPRHFSTSGRKVLSASIAILLGGFAPCALAEGEADQWDTMLNEAEEALDWSIDPLADLDLDLEPETLRFSGRPACAAEAGTAAISSSAGARSAAAISSLRAVPFSTPSSPVPRSPCWRLPNTPAILGMPRRTTRPLPSSTATGPGCRAGPGPTARNWTPSTATRFTMPAWC
jgi:hypothetical protein